MTRSITPFKTTFIILAAFAVGCAATQVASQLVVPTARAGTTPTRWEYMCLNANENITENLNKLGADGWELAAATGYGYAKLTPITVAQERMVWCFKRA